MNSRCCWGSEATCAENWPHRAISQGSTSHTEADGMSIACADCGRTQTSPGTSPRASSCHGRIGAERLRISGGGHRIGHLYVVHESHVDRRPRSVPSVDEGRFAVSPSPRAYHAGFCPGRCAGLECAIAHRRLPLSSHRRIPHQECIRLSWKNSLLHRSW